MMSEAFAEIEKILSSPCALERADLGRLAVLRHRLGTSLLSQTHSPLPPPPAVDVFSGVTGLPEINGAELTSNHLACGVRFHGGLIVRGLVSPQEVERLCGMVDGHDWSAPQPPCDGQGNPLEGAAPMKCSAASLQALIETYQNAGMKEVLTEYFREPPLMMAERVLLDRQILARGLPWHQDAGFFGPNVGAINCFLALDSCGSQSTGLTVVARRFDKVVGVAAGQRGDLTYGAGITQEEVIALAGGQEAVITPELEAGDVILIDEMTFHRTGKPPRKNNKPRTWAITWFFAPSRFPQQRSPLWLG